MRQNKLYKNTWNLYNTFYTVYFQFSISIFKWSCQSTRTLVIHVQYFNIEFKKKKLTAKKPTRNGINFYSKNNQMHPCIKFISFWTDTINVLGFCDRASWANCEVREKTNKMQQLDVYFQQFLNINRASLCPSSGEQDRVLLHAVCCAGSAGCGW